MNKKLLNKAYYAGIREGYQQYAHWRDGVQYVGTCGQTLADALKKLNLEEKRALELLEDRREVKSKLGYARIGLGNV